MQLNADRHSSYFVAEFSKAHAPRQIRRLAPTASGRKTSLAAEHVAQRDPRRARVSRFPPRQFPSAHQEIAGNQRAQQATIKNSTRAQEIQRKELQRVFAILRFRKEHQEL